MPRIHPTAIVDSYAQLADDVEVGPGCVIDGPASLGPGTRLIGHVYLHGRVTLGHDNLLYPFVCIGFDPQDRKFEGATAGVHIGHRNIFRESATVHCSTNPNRPTTIGDDNYVMNNAHVGHDSTVANRCTLVAGSLIGGHGHLHDEVYLGGNAALHQFCRMGRLSLLGGVSAVSKDLPPFCIASGITTVVGVNVVGLRRSGTPRLAIDAVKAAIDTLYLSGHTTPVAADLIEQQAAQNSPGVDLLRELVEFIRTSEKGLCPHAAVIAGHKIQR